MSPFFCSSGLKKTPPQEGEVFRNILGVNHSSSCSVPNGTTSEKEECPGTMNGTYMYAEQATASSLPSSNGSTVLEGVSSGNEKPLNAECSEETLTVDKDMCSGACHNEEIPALDKMPLTSQVLYNSAEELMASASNAIPTCAPPAPPPPPLESSTATCSTASATETGVMGSISNGEQEVPFNEAIRKAAEKGDHTIREEARYAKQRIIGFTGLENLGNTCYLNSIIQCLANTRQLRDFFLGKRNISQCALFHSVFF